MKGPKTDRLDARWLATRLEREDAKGSFIPPQDIRELRDLTRLRVHWLEDLNRIKNPIGQFCETGKIKISSVAAICLEQAGGGCWQPWWKASAMHNSWLVAFCSRQSSGLVERAE